MPLTESDNKSDLAQFIIFILFIPCGLFLFHSCTEWSGANEQKLIQEQEWSEIMKSLPPGSQIFTSDNNETVFTRVGFDAVSMRSHFTVRLDKSAIVSHFHDWLPKLGWKIVPRAPVLIDDLYHIYWVKGENRIRLQVSERVDKTSYNRFVMAIEWI